MFLDWSLGWRTLHEQEEIDSKLAWIKIEE